MRINYAVRSSIVSWNVFRYRALTRLIAGREQNDETSDTGRRDDFRDRDGWFRRRALLGGRQSRNRQMRDRDQQSDRDRRYLVRGRALSVTRRRQARPFDHRRLPGRRIRRLIKAG